MIYIVIDENRCISLSFYDVVVLNIYLYIIFRTWILYVSEKTNDFEIIVKHYMSEHNDSEIKYRKLALNY